MCLMPSNPAKLKDAAEAWCLKAADPSFENCPEELVLPFSNAISLNLSFFVWRNIFNNFLSILEKHVTDSRQYKGR